ncbi:MAG: sugar transferase [Patescibacteria group bacterium]|nr:sugar transferase [Patescibacteria group bacterium]
MTKLKISLILIANCFSFFVSLALTILIRYGFNDFQEAFWNHTYLFVLLFIFWLAIVYIFDLWSLKFIEQKSILFKSFILATGVFLFGSIVFLYIFDKFLQPSPKTNLLIFSVIFLFLNYGIKIFLNRLFFHNLRISLLVLDKSQEAKDLISSIKIDKALGYDVVDLPGEISLSSIETLISKEKKNIIIIIPNSTEDELFINLIYKLLPLGIKIMGLSEFYESILLKEPLDGLSQKWFITNLKSKKFYTSMSRLTDIILSLFFIILLSPIFLLCIISIKLFDKGTIFFVQKRAGKNDKEFLLYKFRTMDSNIKGPLWTEEQDKRITKIGKILRELHFDELPQLFNIFKGDMSFVGPRAESVDLVNIYKEELPYYEIRSIIKPGLTGWAQIHYRPSASLIEAKEKLRYDFFYIKYRSQTIDFLVLLKTVKLFFVHPK